MTNNQIGINLLAVSGSPLPGLFEYMSLAGDGVTFSAIGDYSGSPVEFYVAPSADQIYMISQITIQLEDSGGADSGDYGNGITLTNGIRVIQTFNPDTSPSADGQIDFMGPGPVRTNGDWDLYGRDFVHADYGSGDEYLTWVFVLPQIIRLTGSGRQRLGVRLNDDFAGLVRHSFSVQGAIISGGPAI